MNNGRAHLQYSKNAAQLHASVCVIKQDKQNNAENKKKWSLFII